MSARVSRVRADGHAWSIELVRDADLDVDRREPLATDVPADIRSALRRWLEKPPKPDDAERPFGTAQHAQT